VKLGYALLPIPVECATHSDRAIVPNVLGKLVLSWSSLKWKIAVFELATKDDIP